MKRIAQMVARYLNEVLGAQVEVRPWDGERGAPLFLRERYAFLEGRLLETPLLFMASRTPDEETPATIRKHLAQAHEKSGRLVVYVREGVTSYNRKRLIEHRIPFIVPGRQMYLPPLGLDFRERFDQKKRAGDVLGPSTQAVLIHMLLRTLDDSPVTAVNLKPHLRYSAITLSRAFDELESAGLAESTTVDRTRELRLLAHKRSTWEKALPLMRSPIRRLLHARGEMHALRGLVAGLSALARRSMLAEPSSPVVAVSREDWRSGLQHGAVETIPLREPGAADVEVWMYPPHILSDGDAVDPLSLYLSLREDADERVQGALDRMLDELPW